MFSSIALGELSGSKMRSLTLDVVHFCRADFQIRHFPDTLIC